MIVVASIMGTGTKSLVAELGAGLQFHVSPSPTRLFKHLTLEQIRPYLGEWEIYTPWRSPDDVRKTWERGGLDIEYLERSLSFVKGEFSLYTTFVPVESLRYWIGKT